jgi:hypothetical protein
VFDIIEMLQCNRNIGFERGSEKFVMNVTKGITQIAVARMLVSNFLKMLHYIYIYI